VLLLLIQRQVQQNLENINIDHYGTGSYAAYLSEINPLEIINAHKAHGYGFDWFQVQTVSCK
jgi:hypothetical protein